MSATTVRTTLRALVLAVGMLAVATPANLALAGPLSWIGGERVQGSGKVVKQNREVGHFTALAISIGGNVEIRQGGTEGVTVETDDNLQALIETVVENGTLRIRPAKKNQSLETRTMKIVVMARTLERVSMAGSGAVAADKLNVERMQFDIGGSGELAVRELRAESLAVSLGGSGNLKVGGNVERLQISIGGSGEVDAGRLATRDTVVSIGGSGEATVWATKSLNLSVAGSGDVGYYGDPKVSQNIRGSGGIKRLGAAPR
nr:head GIN domain-containing protein [uncultured Duganella sp.]